MQYLLVCCIITANQSIIIKHIDRASGFGSSGSFAFFVKSFSLLHDNKTQLFEGGTCMPHGNRLPWHLDATTHASILSFFLYSLCPYVCHYFCLLVVFHCSRMIWGTCFVGCCVRHYSRNFAQQARHIGEIVWVCVGPGTTMIVDCAKVCADLVQLWSSKFDRASQRQTCTLSW